VRKAALEGISIEATEGLWTTLIRPILEYGAEVWGAGSWQAAEQIQQEMGRKLLGMGSKADEAIRGDLGWWSMQARRDFARLKFWRKIVNLPDDRILKEVYKASKSALALDPSSWVYETQRLLGDLGLAHIWQSEDTGNAKDWQCLIKKCIHQKEIEKWRAGLEKKSKLRVYRKLKTEFGREAYLALPTEQRCYLAMLRSGTNCLRIETGRWRGEAVEARICLLCGMGAVEDEEHLILGCCIYNEMRENLYEQVNELTGWNGR